MANDSAPLFNYYVRYPWGPADFTNMQDGIVDIVRDSFASLEGAGLLTGGTVAPSGSISGVTVTALTAMNDDGYLLVTNNTRFVDLADGNGSNPRIDLIVARPLLTNGAMISRPTSPYESVPLTVLQQCELAVVQGTPAASPSIPSKLSGDVILATVLVPTSATSISGGNINQTTQHENGKTVRYANTNKLVELRARGTNNRVLDAYGSGTAAAARFTGQGNGAGASDDSIELVQNLLMSGSNPAIATAFLNRLTKKNIVKAWGIFTCTSVVTVNDGFNINTTTTDFFNVGTVVRVQFAQAMANATYAVLAQRIGAASAYAANLATSRFDVFDSVSLANSNNIYAFIVLATQ